MAASSPLHRDASASRQPSSHSLHGFTACNAALPSHKIEGLVGPLRPLSGSRSCGRPPRPRPLPFARASRADAWTKTGACGRTVRTPPCNRILEATTMRRTAGIKNNIGTRVERREKPPNSLPPYFHPWSHRARTPSTQLAAWSRKSSEHFASHARASSARAAELDIVRGHRVCASSTRGRSSSAPREAQTEHEHQRMEPHRCCSPRAGAH